MASRRDDSSSLPAYMPDKALNFGDAYDLLCHGEWVEVSLRRRGGGEEKRLLWVQPAPLPVGFARRAPDWAKWGKGERYVATERVPDAVLRCALFYPHRWVDGEGARELGDYFARGDLHGLIEVLIEACLTALADFGGDPRWLRFRLLGWCGDLLHSEEDTELKRKLVSVLPQADAEAARVFEELRRSYPDGGLPQGGIALAQEFHRRLKHEGLHKPDKRRGRSVREGYAELQVKLLIFSEYLPRDHALQVAVSFFVEALALLTVATTGRIGKLGDLADPRVRKAFVDLASATRGYAREDAGQETTLGEVQRVILRGVHGGEPPRMRGVNYSKCLKAAQLRDQHGHGWKRVAREIGMADATKTYGTPSANAVELAKLYAENGRRILAAMPGHMKGA